MTGLQHSFYRLYGKIGANQEHDNIDSTHVLDDEPSNNQSHSTPEPSSTSYPYRSSAFTGSRPPTHTRIERLELKLKNSNIYSKRWMTFVVLISMLVAECPALGLATNAASHFDFRKSVSPDPTMIFIVAAMGLGEALWICLVTLLLIGCSFHFIFFLSIAVFAVSSFGSGIFALVLMGISMANSVCEYDRHQGTCNTALRKGLAAGCLRILLT